MNILDIFIPLLMLAMAARWSRVGLVQGVFSLLGFLGGVLLGAYLAPFLIRLVSDPGLKIGITIATVITLGSCLSTAGERIGKALKSKREDSKLHTLDAILGAAFSIALAGIYVWLFSAILSGSPYPRLNKAFQQSHIVQAINRSLPPAPAFLARIGSLAKTFEFPQVFVGPEPQDVIPVAPPGSAELAAAVTAAGKSTVAIQGTGCGGVLRGSGFVAAPNTVVTNAHVIAGTTNVTITDIGGSKPAQVIYFDPDLDLAVLRTTNLAGPPLTLASTNQPRGTTGATLGFPGGGDFKAGPAAILQQMLARGLNIYGQRNVDRQIYVLQTTVIPGNSGGPVVLSDGTVIGVIFAQSLSSPNTGYALTSQAVRTGLNQALNGNQLVSTQTCAAD